MQARDEAGNRRLSGGDEFQVLLTGPSASLAATVTDKGDGTYSVAYTASVAGVYQLSITVGEWLLLRGVCETVARPCFN